MGIYFGFQVTDNQLVMHQISMFQVGAHLENPVL